MGDLGDSSRERLTSRTWWNAAMLAGILSTMVALGGAAATVLPGFDVAMRVVSGALAVIGTTGVWAAVRAYGSRSGKLLVLALACALGSSAALVALRSMA
ncbi:hypothetical protein J7F01_33875 [Streptomyces sp. ISL-22]|uniref:hypothetical protein n=1 Tax=unclassified Streptomyces TaxID=2593676 RepID=UPI001BE4E834|nr:MULTISPECIES: hypothetical protein [unclassified Streptomyces]MBT2421263.1 hypothetical protein [Streptomyces sp. ISL-24]MBT2437062.1 hypothetical protein [Streptomyces sp. ISL-22]